MLKVSKMNRGFSTFEDLGSDVDLIEDYDECQSVSKKVSEIGVHRMNEL